MAKKILMDVDDEEEYISTTKLAKLIQIESAELFELLYDYEWITREKNSW